jgi:hypothetical protein
VGKPEGKRLHVRHRRRWVENVKIDFQKVGCGALTGSIWLGIEEVVGTCECTDEDWVLSNAGNFLSSCETVTSGEELFSMELVSQ